MTNEQPLPEEIEELLAEEPQEEELPEPGYVPYPWPAPLTPATPVKEPPLFSKPQWLRVRIGHDGFADVEGERRYISKSNAGAWVNVPRRQA